MTRIKIALAVSTMIVLLFSTGNASATTVNSEKVVAISVQQDNPCCR